MNPEFLPTFICGMIRRFCDSQFSNLKIYNILNDMILMSILDNYFRWGRKKVANANRNSIAVSVSGIQMDLKDVAYYVKRKQGFPK